MRGSLIAVLCAADPSQEGSLRSANLTSRHPPSGAACRHQCALALAAAAAAAAAALLLIQGSQLTILKVSFSRVHLSATHYHGLSTPLQHALVHRRSLRVSKLSPITMATCLSSSSLCSGSAGLQAAPLRRTCRRCQRTAARPAHAALDSSTVIAVMQQAAAYAAVLGGEAAFTGLTVPAGTPGRPTIPLTLAGVVFTLAVRPALPSLALPDVLLQPLLVQPLILQPKYMMLLLLLLLGSPCRQRLWWGRTARRARRDARWARSRGP